MDEGGLTYRSQAEQMTSFPPSSSDLAPQVVQVLQSSHCHFKVLRRAETSHEGKFHQVLSHHFSHFLVHDSED